jgi:bifunctional UDP-N-acetylglucosamine pyrophosphorylase/glucosamine-1-phosphate N-acetyltransferase
VKYPKLGVVILAAGKGTRIKSDLAKVLHRAGGRTLLESVLAAVKPLGARDVFVVVGHQAEEVAGVAERAGAKTILQKPQLGTGHAVMAARRKLLRGFSDVLVLPGDAPLIRTESLASLLEWHQQTGAAATLMTAVLPDPTGYGRIVRRAAAVERIVEQKSLAPEERSINEVNASMYVFRLPKFFSYLQRLGRNNPHREYYLTDVIGLMRAAGEEVAAYPLADHHEALGANTRAELAEMDGILRRRKAEALMASGVTIYMPDTVMVDADVSVGPDTTIEAGVQLLGRTRIGRGCLIRSYSVLTDTVVDDGATVRPCCLIANSRLGRDTVVGPFAHLRDGAELRPGARVGNYVEVKKSVLAEGVKAMHLTYLGDARIGKKTNVGAGTITCNYDGVRKNPTRIGRNVFVGSGTELVAPVSVGNGAYIAAGSTITENVPAEALGIARERQVNKPGWVRAQKRRQAAEARPASGRKTRQRAQRRKVAARATKSKRSRRR